MNQKEKTDMHRYYMEDELYKCESIENKLIELEHQKHLRLAYIQEKKKQAERTGYNWN